MLKRMMIRSLFLLALALSLSVATEAFVVKNGNSRSSSVEMRALWRNWIPQADFLERFTPNSAVEELETNAHRNLCKVSMLAAAILVLTPQAGFAVSGGGLDFAEMDITGKDFSSKNYSGKDFTQVIAKGTNFAKSNLQGCRFYRAYLVSSFSVFFKRRYASSSLYCCRLVLVYPCQSLESPPYDTHESTKHLIVCFCFSFDCYNILFLGERRFHRCRSSGGISGRHQHGWCISKGSPCGRIVF
jgi:hypothetical protein